MAHRRVSFEGVLDVLLDLGWLESGKAVEAKEPAQRQVEIESSGGEEQRRREQRHQPSQRHEQRRRVLLFPESLRRHQR